MGFIYATKYSGSMRLKRVIAMVVGGVQVRDTCSGTAPCCSERYSGKPPLPENGTQRPSSRHFIVHAFMSRPWTSLGRRDHLGKSTIHEECLAFLIVFSGSGMSHPRLLLGMYDLQSHAHAQELATNFGGINDSCVTPASTRMYFLKLSLLGHRILRSSRFDNR